MCIKDLKNLISRQINIKINGKSIENVLIKSGISSRHDYSILLAPGRNKIDFITLEQAIDPEGPDNRNLTFSISKLKTEYLN